MFVTEMSGVTRTADWTSLVTLNQSRGGALQLNLHMKTCEFLEIQANVTAESAIALNP